MVYDSMGYTVETNRTIEVNPGVKVEAAVSTRLTVAGVPVWFNASARGGTVPLEYRWAFGTGNTSSEAMTEYRYPTAGRFAPTIQVNDSVGVTAVVKFHLVANPALSVVAGATPVSVHASQSVHLTSEVSGGTPPYNELWSLGSRASSGQGNTTVTLLTPGNWTATVTMTDALGVTLVQTLTCTVLPSPVSYPATSPGGTWSGPGLTTELAVGEG
jgi:hypothetical protein